MKRPDFVHKNGLVEVHQIPARNDNYIYVIRDAAHDLTIVFDPSVPGPALDYCRRHNWPVTHILITHHHYDHVEGIDELVNEYQCPVFGLKDDAFRIPGVTEFLEKNRSKTLGPHRFEAYFTPGHTLGHVSYYFPELKFLFCGDTLFSMGCGKLFEGTPEMMLVSLAKLRSLPADTTFFCGHEYTLKNTEFALSLEPKSGELLKLKDTVQDLRQRGLPTVPALLDREIKLNPFLRWDDPALKSALNMSAATDLEVFTHIRSKRNSW